MKVTEVSQPGKPRQIQAFELRMNIIADATIDLLFTKNRVTLEHTPIVLCTSSSVSSVVVSLMISCLVFTAPFVLVIIYPQF